MGDKIPRTFPHRMVFHVDMDAFFAAVEQLENPAYRGKPVIVGGAGSVRGVVSSASYEARVFGIHSAMPMAQARKRCPHAIYVNGRMEVYLDYSRKLMDCLSEFSPLIEQVSVDEAFLEMTGSEGLFGDARESAGSIKTRIRGRLGLTASVGAAENKFLAKLASDMEKPDGLTVVVPGSVRAFLDPLPVGRLWGVGKKTVEELHRLGLYTIAQLRVYPKDNLDGHFGGRFSHHLHELAHGRDDRELAGETQEKSISHERTFETDSADGDSLLGVLLELSERVARRARKEGLAGRTVTLVWRNPDFSRQSHARTLAEPTSGSQDIYRAAAELLAEISRSKAPGSGRGARGAGRKFRLLGVRLSHFTRDSQQLSLFQNPQGRSSLDQAMDAVRDRFGEDAIRRARHASPDPDV